MSLYEKRLLEDLAQLRDQVRIMGSMTETALLNVIQATLTGDHRRANESVLNDHPINRQMRLLDRLCHTFIARHLPTGSHLRLVSSIIRINIELERIGDYAVIIARESLQLTERVTEIASTAIEDLSAQVKGLLHQALDAFYNESSESAKAMIAQTGHLEISLNSIYSGLMEGEYSRNEKDRFAIYTIFTQLKRVADQSENICEEGIFAITGEGKAQKIYKLLFLDQKCQRIAPMAAAIAEKNYPNSGHYLYAGKEAAPKLHSESVLFMEQHGIDLGEYPPTPFSLTSQQLTEQHVVIVLEGVVEEYLEVIPFHTTTLNWSKDHDFIEAKSDADLYLILALKIKALMELLRGEEAD